MCAGESLNQTAEMRSLIRVFVVQMMYRTAYGFNTVTMKSLATFQLQKNGKKKKNVYEYLMRLCG